MSTATLRLTLVGKGWMGQTISLIVGVGLIRPFNSAAEAREAVFSIRRELLASPKIAAIPGLTYGDHAFGDFAAVTDVRIDYQVLSGGVGQGVFGPTDMTIMAQSTALDFTDPDSEFAVSYNDEEEV